MENGSHLSLFLPSSIQEQGFLKLVFFFGMLNKPFSPKKLLVLCHMWAFFSFFQKPTHLLPSLSPSSLCFPHFQGLLA